MLENSSEFNAVRQDTPNTTNEEPKMNKEENCNIVEAAYRSILQDLIDDAVLEVCFEVHKAAKISHAKQNPSQDIANSNSVYSGKNQIWDIVRCLVCCNRVAAQNFSRHLSLCMGLSSIKRRASQKIRSFEESSGESGDDGDSEYILPSASRKKSKKGNKNVRKQSKSQENALSKPSDNSSNYKDMTYEEKTVFFKQYCGVLTKRTKRLCLKTPNCSQHTNEEREDIRKDLLSSDMNDQITNEHEMIDVDTVEEDTSPKIMPS